MDDQKKAEMEKRIKDVVEFLHKKKCKHCRKPLEDSSLDFCPVVNPENWENHMITCEGDYTNNLKRYGPLKIVEVNIEELVKGGKSYTVEQWRKKLKIKTKEKK